MGEAGEYEPLLGRETGGDAVEEASEMRAQETIRAVQPEGRRSVEVRRAVPLRDPGSGHRYGPMRTES